MLEKVGPEDPETLDACSTVLYGLGGVGNYSTAELESRGYCKIVEDKWGGSSPEVMYALLEHSGLQLRAGLV